MIPEHVAMIAGEDDERVVGGTGSFERGEDLADALVDHLEHSVFGSEGMA